MKIVVNSLIIASLTLGFCTTFDFSQQNHETKDGHHNVELAENSDSHSHSRSQENDNNDSCHGDTSTEYINTSTRTVVALDVIISKDISLYSNSEFVSQTIPLQQAARPPNQQLQQIKTVRLLS